MRKLPIRLSTGAILYPVLLFGALVFAQSLKMAVSHIVFIFVALLPLISAVQLIAARLGLAVSLRVSEDTVKKNSPLRIFIYAKNRTPLPFSLVSATLSLPDGKWLRCVPQRIYFSLVPFSDCRIEKNISFPIRGEYEVKLDEVWVSDLFRCVWLRIPTRGREEVLVLPRTVKYPPDSVTDGHSFDEITEKQGIERIHGDTENIRAYEIGDSPKNIHWKLSSKSESLLVREYSGDGRSTTRIICDLETHHMNATRTAPTEEAEVSDLINADLVIEGAIAVCRRELNLGRTAVITWLDGNEKVAVTIRSELELSENLRRLCMAPMSESSGHVRKLCENLELPAGTTVFVSAYLDELVARECISASSIGTEFVFCTEKESKNTDSAELSKNLNLLSQTGMYITELNII